MMQLHELEQKIKERQIKRLQNQQRLSQYLAKYKGGPNSTSILQLNYSSINNHNLHDDSQVTINQQIINELGTTTKESHQQKQDKIDDIIERIKLRSLSRQQPIQKENILAAISPAKALTKVESQTIDIPSDSAIDQKILDIRNRVLGITGPVLNKINEPSQQQSPQHEPSVPDVLIIDQIEQLPVSSDSISSPQQKIKSVQLPSESSSPEPSISFSHLLPNKNNVSQPQIPVEHSPPKAKQGSLKERIQQNLQKYKVVYQKSRAGERVKSPQDRITRPDFVDQTLANHSGTMNYSMSIHQEQEIEPERVYAQDEVLQRLLRKRGRLAEEVAQLKIQLGE